MAQQLGQSYPPVLPKQKDSKVKNFNAAGQWEGRKASELEILSRSLHVEKIEFDVNSIPDMWARPLLFEMAIFDKDHILHDRMLGEWRGLLAMLALREYLGIHLETKPVEIPPIRDEARAENNTVPFLAALSKLIPQRVLASNTNWHNLFVLLFRGAPIGMTSPMTLVCTATDYYGRIPGIPWFNGQYLCDPSDSLAGAHKLALASWLKKLSDNLQDSPAYSQTSKDWDRLMRLIDDFIADLGGGASANVALSDRRLNMGYGLFAILGGAVQGRASDESHLRLVSSRKNAPEKSVLVVDREIASQWNMPERDIIVWDDISLAMIQFSGVDAQRHTANSRNAEMKKPEEFFTEKLFVVSQPDAFPGAMKMKMSQPGAVVRLRGEEVTPILPIKEELLNYVTPEDLVERIRFEQSNEGIVVKMRLPLSGPDGKGKDFEIAREYRAGDEEVIELQNVPVLEIWPNFKISNNSWKAYYIYYYAASGMSTFDPKPYAFGSDDLQIQDFAHTSDERKRRITQMSHFPEAMICEVKVANPETGRMDNHRAGVILIKQPETLPKRSDSWKVGIDFGATGTNVYSRQSDQEPAPIVFRERLAQVTASGTLRVNLIRDFLWIGDEKPPFLSIFQDFRNSEDANRLRALLDGRIYYYLTQEGMKEEISGLAADLKWSSEKADRLRTRVFLEQLCLQIAAEAVRSGANQIHWSYSFPTAFSPEMKANFSQIWEDIITKCTELAGLARSSEPLMNKTESVATAIFFNKHPDCNASVTLGTLCLDIGGSTSDIAIWQGSGLRWQSSLRLAGREMFSALLYAHPDFLREFGIETAGFVERKEARDFVFFCTLVDAMLKERGKDLFNVLPMIGGDNRVREFLQLIALGMSGIFYYIGLVLKHLESSGKYEKQIPDVYIGGNAANLLHWLASGSFNSTKPINRFFKNILLHSSGFEGENDDLRLMISPNPKAEAAYGLVQNVELGFDEKADEMIVAGEAFSEQHEQRDWNEILSPARLKSGIEVPNKLERIQDFLAAFNEHTREVPRVENIDVLTREVRKRLADSLKEFTMYKDTKAISVEPVFILALKHMLKIKTADWVSRATQ